METLIFLLVHILIYGLPFVVFGSFLSKTSGSSLKITEAIENNILKSDVMNKPIKLSDLKSFFDKSTFVKSAKLTRKAYRDSISKYIENESLAKKLETSTITISELEKNLNEVSCFGNLKKLRIFGIKDTGSKNDSTYLYITEKKETTK